MKSYINHLLSDIQEAYRTNSPNEKSSHESLEDHFRDIDRWMSGDAEHTLSCHCGLKAEAFPPYDQFSNDDLRNICVIKTDTQQMSAGEATSR